MLSHAATPAPDLSLRRPARTIDPSDHDLSRARDRGCKEVDLFWLHHRSGGFNDEKHLI